MNCTDNTNCEDLNFYAGFLDNKPTSRRSTPGTATSASARPTSTATSTRSIEWDVNLEHGVTRENMDAAFSLWWLMLDQYTTYIGAK